VDRKLLDYLPPVLREVMEMQAINVANEPEISHAWDAMALVLANQFLETADARGVANWEKELKIFPKDTDTLERRKARIKAQWNLETPYTILWLRNWLTGICGPHGHEEIVVDYTLDIRLDCKALKGANIFASEIMDLLVGVLPQNLYWKITSSLSIQSRLHVGGTGGMKFTAGIPENTAPPEAPNTLRMGGTGGIRASRPIPESTAPPPSTTILRTGGVCTILSNLSGRD